MNKDAIKICKRVNNKKRNYLVLNKEQCKHYPISPSKALNMFDELAKKVMERYKDEKILIVGFAETATAIGYRVAIKTNSDYIHTTREKGEISRFYNFSENHSHATEQKLASYHFENYDRLVFIEDEVTTGNTILNIINVLKNNYMDLKYGVGSLLNGMSDEHFEKYAELNIPLDYLEHIDNSSYSEKVEKITTVSPLVYDVDALNGADYRVKLPNIKLGNARYGIIPDVKSLDKLSTHVYLESELSNSSCKNILVLGTEEFMYPAIHVAYSLEQRGYNVKCHSTTRSPIAISTDNGYPLYNGVKMPSVYDNERETYLYNLDKYDKVIIITETSAYNTEYLVQSLKDEGNTSIMIYKIGELKDAE